MRIDLPKSMDYGSPGPVMGLLQPLEPAQRPFSNLTMDLITELPAHRELGYDTLMVVVCRFSKWVTLIPCHKELTGAGTFDLLKTYVFRSHKGFPISIVTDRDPRWTGTAFETLCQENFIKLSQSTANHPQTDGQTERMNRSIEEIARSYLQFDQSQLWDMLPDLEFAINDTPIAALQDRSPYEIVMGQAPYRPIDLNVKAEATLRGVPEPVRDRLIRMRTMQREVRESLRQAQQRLVETANRHRRPIPAALRPGAQAYVKRTQLLTPAQRQQLRTNDNVRGRAKLQNKYLGPFKVLARVGNIAFKIELPTTVKAHPVIHAEALKLYQPHNREGLEPDPVEPLFTTDANGDVVEIFEVADIVASRRAGRTRKATGFKPLQYLTKWKHYPLEEAEWTRFDQLSAWWRNHIPKRLDQPTQQERTEADAVELS